MAVVKALAKSLVLLVAIYLFFRYGGDFSSLQSAVLTLVAWVCYGFYQNLKASHQAENIFSPFCVGIHVKWYKLLSDFKLIGGMEQWDRLCEEIEKLPTSRYDVLRSGFSFTVIRPPSDGLLPGLTYSNNRQTFSNDVKFSECIIALSDEYFPTGEKKQHPFLNHPRWSGLPTMYFKRGMDGYEIGLEVQDDWWEDLCKSGQIGELAKTKKRTDHLCGTTRLEIATLPYSEFSIYYQAVDYGQMKKRQEVRDKQLEAHKWKREVDGDAEIRDPWSRLEHKYFIVSHGEI